MDIDNTLARLAHDMSTIASNDMGHLSVAEAALFHTACAAINNLITARETRAEDESEAA